MPVPIKSIVIAILLFISIIFSISSVVVCIVENPLNSSVEKYVFDIFSAFSAFISFIILCVFFYMFSSKKQDLMDSIVPLQVFYVLCIFIAGVLQIISIFINRENSKVFYLDVTSLLCLVTSISVITISFITQKVMT
jgi:hypothetical protein